MLLGRSRSRQMRMLHKEALEPRAIEHTHAFSACSMPLPSSRHHQGTCPS